MWTRRAFMKAGGISVLSFGLGPSFLNRAALASTEAAPLGRGKTLVTIFQRGAMDGLMAVPTLDDAALRKLRPQLAMSAARSAGDNAVSDLDGRFGLHPAFAPLLPWWRDGRLAIVHNVGSPDATRSHFDAQDYMETGTPGKKGTRSGWLNRVVGELGHEASPFRAVALTPSLPRSLYGPQPAVAVTDLADFKVQLTGSRQAAARAGQGFESLYAQTSEELLRDTGAETFDAVKRLSKVEIRNYRPSGGASYPQGPLGSALRQIAMLIKGEVGLEVAFAESGGWDTHVRQGTVQGSFARQARELAQSIAAFWTDLERYRDRVVVMTMTEFGRTVRQNGSGGTDHGHGSCLFALGDAVDGGKVHGDFPGLGGDVLFEGRDLPVTTDFRGVFSGIAGGHLDLNREAALFPGWSGKKLDLIRA